MHSVIELHRTLEIHALAVSTEHFIDNFRTSGIVLGQHIVFHTEIVRLVLDRSQLLAARIEHFTGKNLFMLRHDKFLLSIGYIRIILFQ